MLDMIGNAAGLFLKGKLFTDTKTAMLQLMLGSLLGAILFIVVAWFTGLWWLAGILGGAVSGYVQPILYKNLKFR